MDAHVHVEIQFIRGIIPNSYSYEETMPLQQAYFSGITPEERHLATLLACMEMASNGTTTFADTAGLSPEAVQAVETVGIRGILGESLSDQKDKSTDECLARLEELIKQYPPRSGRHVWTAMCLTGLGSASDRLLIGAKALSHRYQVPLYMHQSWTEQEVEDCKARTGLRPIEHYSKLGILGPNLTLVHMIHVDKREAELLAESDTNVVHCPGPSMRHGLGAIRNGLFPEMLSKGVNVALGSDAAFRNSFDIGQVAYVVASFNKEVRGKAVITAEMALEIATINGACALGVAGEVGSIKVGKRADIVIHTLDAPETHPLHVPVNDLVYVMQSQTVDTVLVDGKPILEGGKLTDIDTLKIYEKIDEVSRNIAERLGLRPRWPVVK